MLRAIRQSAHNNARQSVDPFKSNTNDWQDVREDLEAVSLSACSAAKVLNSKFPIEVFTVGVSDDTAPGTGVYTLLHECASKPENHYFAPTASALETAFEEIATRVSKLRLTH